MVDNPTGLFVIDNYVVTHNTTLALSAPKPVLIDFDNGVSRVAAAHRVPTIVCNTYEEVLADIDSPDMKEFETIVIDTGGSFVTYLKDWAFRTKKDCKTQKGTPNTLKQFGYAKTEFMAFTEKITKVMHKNVIYVFHSEEKADKDGNPVQRLMCEGAARNRPPMITSPRAPMALSATSRCRCWMRTPRTPS